MSPVKLLARLAGLIAVVVAFVLAPPSSFAAYPEKPVTLIIPWDAGGAADATGRMIAALLQKELGQPVEVVNRTGGSGIAGFSAIARAAPDGYTIGVITVEIGSMHWAGLTDLKGADFTPLALYSYDPASIQVRADSLWKTAKDFIEAVKANPGKYKASGTGPGGIWHLAFAGMLGKAGIEPNSVQWTPSPGAAAALQDLGAGNVDVVSCSMPEAAALAGAGKIRSLAVMDAQKLDAYPDVPPLKDAAGIDWQTGVWRGIAGPKGLPDDVAARLADALQKVYASPEFTGFMKSRGYGTVWRARGDFAKWMADSDATLGVVMKAIGNGK